MRQLFECDVIFSGGRAVLFLDLTVFCLPCCVFFDFHSTGRKDLSRQMFFISNMPDSVQMNIGNVPLLAWRKLCTEMVEVS